MSPSHDDHPQTSRRVFLTTSAATIGAGAVAGPLAGSASAAFEARPLDRGEKWPPGPGRENRQQDPDPELLQIMREIDQDRLERYVRKLASFGTRHTASSQTDPNRGIGAACDYIFEHMQRSASRSGGQMTVEKQTYVQQPVPGVLPTEVPITNVIATLRGSKYPDRYYVVSGHYDSRATDVADPISDAPGADDDASGVAISMELARIMATRRPESTLVFAAVSGEEQGLFGSTFMAQKYKDEGVDVQGMFTNDIVGSAKADDGVRDPRSIRLFTEGVPSDETEQEERTRRSVGGENDSPARQLGRFATEVADRPVTGMRIRVIYRRDRYLRGGDHIPFLERGYPAARFTEPNENYAHQHQDVRVEDGKQFGDLVEFCDFGFIKRVARVSAATLWSLSQGPGTPKEVRIDTSELTNDTVLLWDANPERDLDRYEVVFRPTVEDDWTNVVRVPADRTRARVDLSKDNVFFGVRAVDSRGHRSPVAFPRPQS